MNWKTETFEEWKDRKTKWHKWFAWYPVFSDVNKRTYWLETIERRMYDYSGYTGTIHYTYRKGE